MPELPEVETFRRYIDKHALHQKISSIHLASSLMLLDTSSSTLKKKLEGNSFKSTFRHGKFLFITLLQDGVLMLHFGMTGDLIYGKGNDDAATSYALLIRFSNGNVLALKDPRKFGKIALVDSAEAFIEKRKYGEDALLIRQDEFIGLLKKRKAPIKSVLMNQKLIAGIGNEFSDEILFQARIHPESSSAKLKDSQLADLHRKMRKVLKHAVTLRASRKKLSQYFFLENRKAGLPCPEKCQGVTKMKTIGGRSAYFCPSCQKLYR